MSATRAKLDDDAFEQKFLLDYLSFGRTILPRQARVLEAAYYRELEPNRRLALLISLHTLLVQQYEHVAAWILGFRERAASQTALIETLLRYGPGEATLEKILADAKNGDELLALCGISRDGIAKAVEDSSIVSVRIAEMWEGLNLSAAEQTQRKELYNKSKHGMVFVRSARVFDHTSDAEGPLALYAEDRRADPIKLIVVGLQESPDQPKVFSNLVCKLADVLGDLIGFYLLQFHPTKEPELRSVIRSLDTSL